MDLLELNEDWTWRICSKFADSKWEIADSIIIISSFLLLLFEFELELELEFSLEFSLEFESNNLIIAWSELI